MSGHLASISVETLPVRLHDHFDATGMTAKLEMNGSSVSFLMRAAGDERRQYADQIPADDLDFWRWGAPLGAAGMRSRIRELNSFADPYAFRPAALPRLTSEPIDVSAVLVADLLSREDSVIEPYRADLRSGYTLMVWDVKDP